jgi:hypothetical protein
VVGTPADVYALGLTLLEALTGHREYEGEGPETAFARLTRTPSVPDGLPVLPGLLRTMTALDPSARPTAAEVAEQLKVAVPELESVPATVPLVPGSAGVATGWSGTKVMAISAAPAGLTSASARSVASESRRVRQRRLLAGALVATGLAAAAVGVLSLHARRRFSARHERAHPGYQAARRAATSSDDAAGQHRRVERTFT